MKKKNGNILICSAILSLSLFGGVCAVQTANAEGSYAAPTSTVQKDELIAPTSYEQYLELTDPSDVAVNERYTAISDGNVIYVYDNIDNVYREYSHANFDVAKMQFSDSGVLYFADEKAELYQLNPQTATLISETSILHCSTFSLSGDEIYFSIVAGGVSRLFKAPLNDVTNEVMLDTPEIISDTVFSVCDEEIFYTFNGRFLFKYPNGVNPSIALFPNALSSVIATPSKFYCADNTGFYVYNFNDLYANDGNVEPIYTAEGEFSKLTLFDDYVYAVDGNSVRQYSIETEEFTDYEICSSSSSENRLHGSTDVLLCENTLITADHGNRRISIRHANGTYRVIDTSTDLNDDQPQTLAATSNTALLAVEKSAYLYDLENGNFLKKFDFGENKITGVTGVYGKYYFVTNSNGYYVAEKQTLTLENGESQSFWELSNPITKSGASPTRLTSDVYGNLYVTRSGNVYKYDEQGFLDKENAGSILGAITPNAKKIAVDYNGNLYAQTTEQKILRYENGSWSETEIKFDNNTVYTKTPSELISFTFGVEENETYLLFNGNYVTKTANFHLPTVKTIKVNGLDETLFNSDSAEFSVVKTKPNTLLVEIDFNALNGSEYFPYLSLNRSETERTALYLGKTQVFCNTANGIKTYHLLAEYDQSSLNYRTYLALDTDTTPLKESEYFTSYAQGETKYGYVTNNVNMYKYPYLTSLLTLTELEKNAKVQLLGEITQLDHDYYQVSYETSNGVKTGYIPKAYVTDFDGSTPIPEEYLLADDPADTDMIWRLAYIICGFAAICILTDYLILRKKPNHPDEE